MTRSPFTRSAPFVNQADLYRAEASFARAKAKEMMGAGNPNTGASLRKPGSSHCPSCGRWHRPGNICPNVSKGAPLANEGSRVTAGGTPAMSRLQEMIQSANEPPELRDLRGQSMLQPAAPAEAPAGNPAEDLANASQHLQSRQEGYLNALRSWQAKYGGQ